MATEVSKSQAAPLQKVLDEDEWTECLEAIIQRDYFPIVPKLQNKLEWLEVSHRGAPLSAVLPNIDCFQRSQILLMARRLFAVGTPSC